MKRIALFTMSTLMFLCFCACGSKNPEGTNTSSGVSAQEPIIAKDAATVFTTTFDKSYAFNRSVIAFGKPSTMSPNIVRFTDETYQSVDGFGFAITQSSCYNLLKMPKTDRTRLLTELFSPEYGAGSSLIRVCIGGSDFSMDEFTCCDTPGIENFAMHSLDIQYLFPILDEIYKINPDVQIIGSPWSCPRWMKMSLDGKTIPFNSWTSGRLNPSYYADYATYFVKWIQAMQERGYKVLGVTLQNEPLNTGNSMSLYMSWQEQANFIKVVGPAFHKAGLEDIKIMVFDHTYSYNSSESQNKYPLKIYAIPEASKYVAGSAWHSYGGFVTELDDIYVAFPDKGIWFTEASIGEWNYGTNGFSSLVKDDFRDIIMGTLSRYGKGVTLWNLMLDDEGKPYRPKGCSTCYGAVSVSHASYSYSSLDKKSQWYDILHASAVIKPGAVRIGTKGYVAKDVTYLAFRNPDASYGVIFLNVGSSQEQFVFTNSDHSVNVKVPAKAIVSVIWKD